MAPSVPQYYLKGEADKVTYFPRLAALTDVAFTNARYKIDEQREQTYSVEFDEGPVPVDWDNAEILPIDHSDLDKEPRSGASFADCSPSVNVQKNFVAWEKGLKRWIRQNETIEIYRSKQFKVTSEPGESEGDFRARLQHIANEQRDEAAEKLRKRYASKVTTLQNRLLRAEQAIQREQQQSSNEKVNAAISFGTAILSAVLGRKTISSTTAGKMGTAMRKAGNAKKQAGDVARAKQTADKVRTDLAALNEQLSKELTELTDKFNAQDEELTAIPVRPKSTDIHIPLIGLVWLPYEQASDGRYSPVWQAKKS